MRFGRARRSVTAATVGLVVLAGITACSPEADAPDTPVTRVQRLDGRDHRLCAAASA